MIRIGPAGNSERFYEEGYKRTEQAPAWLRAMGLSAMEYSSGRGVTLSEPTARAIAAAAKASDIQMSIHAPYYINCATDDEQKRQNTLGHFQKAAAAIDQMGGDRVVFHIGSPGKQKRSEAFARSCEVVLEARRQLIASGLGHIHLCPETMGRAGQIGTLSEVLQLCLLDDTFVPVLDFGHLHTVGLGALKGPDEFRAILDKLISELGFERAKHFHSHFSRIEYTASGEKRHWRLCDTQFGPDFAHLAPLIAEYKLEPVIICESSGTQADDACAMRQLLVESGAPV